MNGSERYPEEVLVKRSQRGDLESFSELVGMYQHRVYSLVVRVCGLDHAEDITQEVFIKAFRMIGQFRGESRFYTWLYRVSVNTCSDWQRQARKTSFTIIPWDDEHEGAYGTDSKLASLNDFFEMQEMKEYIEGCLETLSDQHRVVLVLHDMEGFNYQEISQICQIPLGTVKSRLYHARISLRSLLEKEMDLLGRDRKGGSR